MKISENQTYYTILISALICAGIISVLLLIDNSNPEISSKDELAINSQSNNAAEKLPAPTNIPKQEMPVSAQRLMDMLEDKAFDNIDKESLAKELREINERYELAKTDPSYATEYSDKKLDSYPAKTSNHQDAENLERRLESIKSKLSQNQKQ